MLKIVRKKEFMGAVALLLCCGLIAVLFSTIFIKKETKPHKPENVKISYSDKYEGFKKDTKISKIIIPHNGQIHETITIIQKSTQPSYIMPLQEQEKQKYEVQYHIENTDNQYVDITFLIDESDKTLKTAISGLHYNEKISLKLNEENIFNNTPADWAGKIEFKNTLANNNEIKICAFISKENKNLQSICHQTTTKEDIT